MTPPPRPASTSRGRPSRRQVWAIATAAAAVLVVAGVLAVIAASGSSSLAGPPAQGTVVVASASSKAARAATASPEGTAEQAAAAYLAAQPTAVWLTPEADPADVVGERIAALADEAREQSARLAVVVYGLPGRDCGNHSAGGLDPAGYAEWTGLIGEALEAAPDVSPIVILEPDAIALAPDCGNIDERAGQLSDAVDRLAGERTWIYLDGGHSNWRPVDEMASLLQRVGDLGRVRGFATNVSNYNETSRELAYAHALSERLGGLHAVVDTSRNGAGSDGEWCNPSGRLVGEPGGTVSDRVVDTNLWIKPPGESDGPCNGGPEAGTWWPDGAVALTRQALAR
ncbi:MAG: glycoside hydrolase family 6 protein [Microbacterium sp.]